MLWFYKHVQPLPNLCISYTSCGLFNFLVVLGSSGKMLVWYSFSIF